MNNFTVERMRIFSFRNIRIIVLLFLMGAVALYAKDQRLVTQGWYRTLEIVVYPINPNGSPQVDQFIDSLSSVHFADIDKFIKRESEKYNVITSVPTITRLGQRISDPPPAPPKPGSDMLTNIFWSMKLRWWIWQDAPTEADDKYLVRMFVQYHDPGHSGQMLHSVGLQKGLTGIVNAFAVHSQKRQNNMVIAHEFFHTVGASDKYDAAGLPVPPHGLGNPHQSPLYPQKKTEIMAGRRAISASQAEMPDSFRHVVVGQKTAAEIGWIDDV